MIGFDRPIKPEWIYNLLNIVKINDKPINYNIPFEKIAKELTGKEGKRKVKTIIFRSFIYSFQEKKTVIENNSIIHLSKNKTIDFMKPIYLFKLFFDYEISRFLLSKIKVLFDPKQEITTTTLNKRMVEKYGDRDVVKRSVGSFLKTLIHFGIITKKSNHSFVFNDKETLNNEQMLNILYIYANTYLNSKQIDLSNFDNNLFDLYNVPDLYQLASEFNQQKWEYIRDRNRNILLLY